MSPPAPRVGYHPGWHGQAEKRAGRIHIAKQRAASDFSNPLHRIDRNFIQEGKIKHDPAVACGQAGQAVPTAANREQRAIFCCYPEGFYDVRNGSGADNDSRAAVGEAIPDPSAPVVIPMRWIKKFPFNPRLCERADKICILHPEHSTARFDNPAATRRIPPGERLAKAEIVETAAAWQDPESHAGLPMPIQRRMYNALTIRHPSAVCTSCTYSM